MGNINFTGINIEVNICPRRAAIDTVRTTATQSEAASASPSTEEAPLLPVEPETEAESATPGTLAVPEPLLPARIETEIESDSA